MPLKLSPHYDELFEYINSEHAGSCPFCGYDVNVHDREANAFRWNLEKGGYLVRVSCDDGECGAEWEDVFRLEAVVFENEVVEKKSQ